MESFYSKFSPEDQDTLKRHLHSDLLLRAKHLAHVAHYGQVRKDGEPFINHPKSVQSRLMDLGVDDGVMLAAAILHDTIEDTFITYEDIEYYVNREVANLVWQLTIPKHGKVRQDDLLRIKSMLLLGAVSMMDHRAILIKYMDRLDNLSDCERAGWSREKILSYAHDAQRMMWTGRKFVYDVYYGTYPRFPHADFGDWFVRGEVALNAKSTELLVKYGSDDNEK